MCEECSHGKCEGCREWVGLVIVAGEDEDEDGEGKDAESGSSEGEGSAKS